MATQIKEFQASDYGVQMRRDLTVHYNHAASEPFINNITPEELGINILSTRMNTLSTSNGINQRQQLQTAVKQTILFARIFTCVFIIISVSIFFYRKFR